MAEPAAQNASNSWKFPDTVFERLVYVAGGFALVAPWIFQVLVRRQPSIGPDAAVVFLVPTTVGTFLGSLAIFAGAASGRIIQGLVQGVLLFAFFPASALGLASLFNLDLKTQAANVLSAVPGLLAPEAYQWTVKKYVHKRKR
jgi:hypothetical protein